jgi:hypothetical protein
VKFLCSYKGAKWKEIGTDTQRRIEFDDVTQQNPVMERDTLDGCLRGRLRVSERRTKVFRRLELSKIRPNIALSRRYCASFRSLPLRRPSRQSLKTAFRRHSSNILEDSERS